MPDYLLPCSCGVKTPVSTVQAGETVRCACGAELLVPSMRGLRALEPADAGGATRRGAWEDRHRVAFLLVVASLASLALAAYLGATRPAGSTGNDTTQMAREIKTPLDAFQVYAQLGGSLAPPPMPELPEDKTRSLMGWGMGIAAVLAGCGLAGAAAVLARGSGRRT